MLRKSLKQKKANTTLFHVLSGAIIGFLFLIFFLKVLIPIIFNSKDYGASFDNFVDQVEELSGPEIEVGERLSPILLLDDKSAIIAFAPKRILPDKPNGRLGDGNLHVIQDKEFYTREASQTHLGIYEAEDPNNYHFLRPDSCAPEKTCFCLCKKLTDEQYDSSKHTTDLDKFIIDQNDKDKYNPYLLTHTQQERENFLYPANEEDHYFFHCKSLTCEETTANLYEPVKSDYFSEVYEGLIMFENGFVLSRERLYATKMSERTNIHIIKLLNNEILITTRMESILEVDKQLDFEIKMLAHTQMMQETELLLNTYYAETQPGVFELKDTSTTTVAAAKHGYDALDQDMRVIYYLDENSNIIYKDPTPYDILPYNIKRLYVESPEGFRITEALSQTDLMTVIDKTEELQEKTQSPYAVDPEGNILLN